MGMGISHLLLRNSKGGFSLAGVLVASAIGAVIMIALMSMINNAQKGQKSVSNAIDFSIMKSTVLLLLNNSDLCKASILKANEVDPGEFDPALGANEIAIKLGNSVLASQNVKIDNQLEIKRVYLEQVAGSVPDASVVGKTTYIVELVIEAEKIGEGNYGGNKLSTKMGQPFFLYVQTDDVTKKIENCGLTSDVSNVGVPPGPGAGGGGGGGALPAGVHNYSCIAKRKSTCSINSDPNMSFCALQSMINPGCKECSAFSCNVGYNSATQIWTLSGARGNDPDATCSMICTEP